MSNAAISEKNHNLGRSLVYVAVSCTIIWAVSSSRSLSKTPGQEQSAILDKLEAYDNEPLRIVEVKATNKSIRIGEKFSSGDHWLKNLSFRVKNTSEKDIIYIEIDFNFPETKTSGNEMSYRINLGHRPGARDANPALLMKTSDEAILTLDQQKYSQLVRFVEQRHAISGIRKAVIRIGFVIFADGTAWSGGLFHRQDPNNPNRYIPVNN